MALSLVGVLLDLLDFFLAGLFEDNMVLQLIHSKANDEEVFWFVGGFVLFPFLEAEVHLLFQSIQHHSMLHFQYFLYHIEKERMTIFYFNDRDSQFEKSESIRDHRVCKAVILLVDLTSMNEQANCECVRLNNPSITNSITGLRIDCLTSFPYDRTVVTKYHHTAARILTLKNMQ